MKKLNKVLAILCTSAIAVSGVAAFTACGGGDEHDHNAHLTYVSDGATQHHGECTEDNYKTEKENHTWGTNNKCSKCGETKPAEVTITLDKETATVEEGQTVEITATVTGSTAAITAESGTQAVATATVSGKKITVTGVKEGSAVITVRCGDASKTCKVTVTKAAEVKLEVQEVAVLEDATDASSIYGDLTTMELDVDYTGKGTVTATIDEEIATAAYADGKVTLTAVKAGKTELVLTDGEKEAKCVVEVATFGLSYGVVSVDEQQVIEVADGELRTSNDVYIPGYWIDENEGVYLPVTQLKGGVKNAGGGWDGNGAFTESNVVSVYAGDNVRVVGANAFRRCAELTTFVGGPELKTIDGYAFDGAAKLKNVDFTKSTKLDSLIRCAFSASGLEEISLPASITFIGDSCFSGCVNLRIFKLEGEGLKTIEGSTFQKCNNLLELWLPASLTEIKGLAFYYSDESWSEIDLTEPSTVYFAGTREQWNTLKAQAASQSANTFFNDHNKNLTVHCADD